MKSPREMELGILPTFCLVTGVQFSITALGVITQGFAFSVVALGNNMGTNPFAGTRAGIPVSIDPKAEVVP